jgi:hypothetical protein
LLEGMCPVCGRSLGLASSVSSVMGFRLFDLGVLGDQEEPSAPPDAVGQPAHFVARRGASATQEGLDAERWLDEGGSLSCEAVAEWPAAR